MDSPRGSLSMIGCMAGCTRQAIPREAVATSGREPGLCWGRADGVLPRGSPPTTTGRGGSAHDCGSPHRPGQPTVWKAVAHLACALIAADALAIGRVNPTQGGALYALGVELPFWPAEHTHRRRVVPLPRRSDAWCACCAPW